jgi:hypothetical protein
VESLYVVGGMYYYGRICGRIAGMTIPDEAVQAAHAEYHKVLGDSNRSNPMLAALTAAAPFLQGVKDELEIAIETAKRGEIKDLLWFNVEAVCSWCYAKTALGEYSITWSFNESGQKLHYPDGTTKQFDGVGYGDREAAKAAAQADYEARILSAIEVSALEPSPRAQALEEAAKVAEQFRNKDWIAHDMHTGVFPTQSEPGVAIAAAIRALSSQPLATTEIIGEGATVWLLVDENKDGSQEIIVTDAQGFAELPDGEYLFVRHGSSQPVADGWLPIETAPKGTAPHHWDAPSILVSDGQSVDQAEWECDDGEPYWHATGGKRKSGNFLGYEPTHWRPLPASPEVSG